MKSCVEIDADRPEELREILAPSLESGDKVDYSFRTEEDRIVIHVETDGLGVLRGCTDTVFRLTTLAEKLY